MRQLISLLFPVLLVTAAIGNAQVISPEIGRRFDPGIVVEVFQTTRYAGLDKQQQTVLALLLRKRDSVLTGLIAAGTPAAFIEAKRQAFDKELHALSGMNKYYDSLAVLDGVENAKNELRLYKKYRPTQECMDQLTLLVKEKDISLARVQEDLLLSARVKDSMESAIFNRQDSLVQSTLFRDGVFIGSGQFVAALHFRKRLHLTEGQVDSLVTAGMHAKYMRDSALSQNPYSSPIDIRQYENYNLSIILSEQQYTAVLDLQYRQAAGEEAAHAWQSMEKLGLITTDMDKEKLMREFTNYYIQVKASSSLYAYDLTKQSAYARSVKDNMPKELRLLSYARKANITSANMQTLNSQ